MVGSNKSDVVEKSTKKELSCDEIVEHILKPAQKLGAYQIQYSGGEFLLRDDAINIVTKTIEMGYEPRILTNGTHISDDLLKTLKEIAGRKIVLVFGINSISDQLVNKETRNVVPNVFFRALELCKKHKIKRHVVVNVGQFNMTDLHTTFQWLADNKITFNRSPFSARMSGKEYFHEMGFSSDDMKNHIHPALRKHVNGYLSYTPFFLSPELHTEVSGGESRNMTVPQNPFIGCWIGSWLSISAEGNVAPCVLLVDELNAGNVREKPLYEIIDESEIFQNLLNRHKLKGKCGKCRYKITCGGCRAMAYYHTHDYMAEDPTCFFEPEDESTVSEFEKETNAVFVKYLKIAMYGGIYKPLDKGLPKK
jgi:radical SAM protein with 4Fe4S-binding SPASM domain